MVVDASANGHGPAASAEIWPPLLEEEGCIRWSEVSEGYFSGSQRERQQNWLILLPLFDGFLEAAADTEVPVALGFVWGWIEVEAPFQTQRTHG